MNQNNTTEILHVGTFAGHIEHRPLRGKGTAQAPTWWRSKKYQADEDASIATAHPVDSSTDQDTQVEGSLLSPIPEHIEQYELMTVAYAQVGRDFDTRDQLLGENYNKLQQLEMVPYRWPLARLLIPLQKRVERLTRVVAGCCWGSHGDAYCPT